MKDDALKTVLRTYRRHAVTIRIYQDTDMGPPWNEHDGHGEVSDWTQRDKLPGEWLLHKDGRHRRYYDAAGAQRIALRDGWGVRPETLAVLTTKAGRPLTRREVAAVAVRADFEHLRSWCNDEWFWLGYQVDVEGPYLSEETVDSCWGIDCEDYLMETAMENARYAIDAAAKEHAQSRLTRAATRYALVWP